MQNFHSFLTNSTFDFEQSSNFCCHPATRNALSFPVALFVLDNAIDRSSAVTNFTHCSLTWAYLSQYKRLHCSESDNTSSTRFHSLACTSAQPSACLSPRLVVFTAIVVYTCWHNANGNLPTIVWSKKTPSVIGNKIELRHSENMNQLFLYMRLSHTLIGASVTRCFGLTAAWEIESGSRSPEE